ncbi:type VI secretion system baseplate subunit TssG [Orbus sturtevantii]|uniref:type VI secretion system baseplate subunit TssG n=1 Tax=Orbus sturtevantii TaxID=3074109 RepID=UPI00370D24D2
MESQQDITTSPLMQELEAQLPKMNFYRFCQLLEQITDYELKLGTSESPVNDPLRFAPSAEMSFPAGELRCIEREPYLNRPITVRTRFLGLYGVDSVLPSILLDDIVKRKDGYEAVVDFLDIFNHRIITQFYRIWLKHHYPASFIRGGSDPISQCLLGLTGLGIKGTSEQIGTPVSRFLALLGLVTQRTRTAGGIVGVIKVLVPNCDVEVEEFYPVRMSVPEPAKLGRAGIALGSSTVLGKQFLESNQTVLVKIKPRDNTRIDQLLPDGQLHHDIMTLLRAYLGYQVDAQLDLYLPARFLPKTQLKSRGVRLGQTASLICNTDASTPDVVVNLGRYRGIAA